MLSQLIASPGVVETVRLEGPVGVMALHGGLESGTDSAAAALAKQIGGSLYVVIQPDDLAWHIPSIEYLPSHSEALEAFVAHVRVAISVHGFGRPGLESAVLVGGRNRELAAAIAEAIEPNGGLRVVSDLEEIPRGLRGLHPANPVNLPAESGVQLELSTGAREPDVVARIVDAVAGVLGRGRDPAQAPQAPGAGRRCRTGSP
ncbi:MAG: poly-gamma-glutamate hydrolase family protein [Acidimicrobiia bacterium]